MKALCCGRYDEEKVFNCDTGRYDWKQLKIYCRNCGHSMAAMLHKDRITIDGGWKWDGTECKVPYNIHTTTCRKCKLFLQFETYTPQ